MVEGKVLPFKLEKKTYDDVQQTLVEAADAGFIEVVVLGKYPDGSFSLSHSGLGATTDLVMRLELMKLWLYEKTM